MMGLGEIGELYVVCTSIRINVFDGECGSNMAAYHSFYLPSSVI